MGVFFSLLSLKASAQNGLNATVYWDASLSADVAGYNVYYGTASRNYANFISVDPFTTSQTIYGLATGKTYFMAVTTVDSEGNESDYSQETYITTPGPPILAAQTTYDIWGDPFLELTSPNLISYYWELDYSFDLVNWNIYDDGTSPNLDDFIPMYIDYLPQMFFRLVIY